MAQAMKDEEGEYGQEQLHTETAFKHHPQDNMVTKLIGGHATHDQICDAMHEQVLNSELAWREASSLSLQDKERCQNNPGRNRN